MLTGKLVRVRMNRDRIIPYYLDVDDSSVLEMAERLLDLFRGQEGRTRGELEDDLHEAFGNEHGHLIYQGLAKLLEDRCEFEVLPGQSPEQVREVVFRLATEQRKALQSAPSPPPAFDRDVVLLQATVELGGTLEELDRALFAD